MTPTLSDAIPPPTKTIDGNHLKMPFTATAIYLLSLKSDHEAIASLLTLTQMFDEGRLDNIRQSTLAPLLINRGIEGAHLFR